MMSTWLRFSAVTFMAVVFGWAGQNRAAAAWPTSSNNQIVVHSGNNVQHFGSVSDGAGGVIVVYQIYGGLTGQDIYARRYNSAGELAWAGGGTLGVCVVDGDQTDVRVLPTGDGGCYVVWSDLRYLTWDIFVQKISQSGQIQFEGQGKPLLTGTANTKLEHAIADGTGGFIIAYNNILTSARRYNSFGTALWASEAAVSDTFGDQVVSMISDGAGGAFVGLERVGVGTEVVIVPVSGTGVVDFDQVLSQNAAGNQYNLELALRPGGSVLAAWYDGGVSPSRIMTNHFVNPLVFDPNVPLNTGPGAVNPEFSLIPSAHGDPIIVYGRNVAADDYNTYVGRVNTAGGLVFNTVMPDTLGQQFPDNVVETPGGAIRVIYRNTYPGPADRKLVAAQFNVAGEFRWNLPNVTPLNATFKTTGNAQPVIGSQNSTIVFSSQLTIPNPNTFNLIRIRSNGDVGGEQSGSDSAFGQSSITALRKKKKATMMGNVVVTNEGSLPTAATTAAFYLSPTPGFTSAGANFLFEVPIPVLQPGESVVVQPGMLPPKKPGKKPKVRKVKLPKVVLTQQHYILIQLDGLNVDPELDENNNTYVIGPI